VVRQDFPQRLLAVVALRRDCQFPVCAVIEGAGAEFTSGGQPGMRMKAMSPASDQSLIAVLDADEIWIIRHDGADHANSLRRALQKAADLATAGHHVSSIRNLGDRTIIEPDQIIRLLKHIGQA
jgi:hypothetical protein